MKKESLEKELRINESESGGIVRADTDRIVNLVQDKIAVSENERKVYTMKSKKKLAAVLVAAALAVSATAFAANGIIASWTSSSSSKPDYTTLPTAQECVRDIGYAPKLVGSFENGYVFKDASIVKNDLKDENGGSVEKFNSISMRYEKDGDEVYISAEKHNSDIEEHGEKVEEIIIGEGGKAESVIMYYENYENKVVPPDYKMTEEDKKAEAEGKLVFSYGSDKTEINNVQSYSFEKDGINYNIMQINGKLTQEGLEKMAEELAEK